MAAPAKDLREWIALLEREHELVRVRAEVDPDLEITEIVDRVVKSGGPALLFENVKGSRLPLRAELVDQEREPRALHVLEEEGGPTGLDDPVDDLGDLEIGIDLRPDADELLLALEERDPLAEILRRGRHTAVSLGAQRRPDASRPGYSGRSSFERRRRAAA